MVWCLLVAALGGVAVRVADYGYARRAHRRYRAWSEHVERDETGLRVEFRPIEAGDGETAILFVPGFADGPLLYRYFAPYFAERGFACKAMRLPGFGDPLERAAQVTRADWMEAVRAAAETLREGRSRLWIVAHSLGAAITVRVLQEETVPVDGVILLAPLIEVSDERSPVFDPDVWFAVGQQVVVYSDMLELLFPVDAHDPRVPAIHKRDLFIPMNLYAELFALLSELRDADTMPDIPVLMVLSARDKVVDSEAAREWFEGWNTERKRARVVEPAGHVLPLDTGWEQLVDEMEEWIRFAITSTISHSLHRQSPRRGTRGGTRGHVSIFNIISGHTGSRLHIQQYQHFQGGADLWIPMSFTPTLSPRGNRVPTAKDIDSQRSHHNPYSTCHTTLCQLLNMET